MPRRAGVVCSRPSCGSIVKGGQCPQCGPVKRRRDDAGRASSARRGYGYRWRKIRGGVLARRPLCVDPYKRHPNQTILATEVDHIKPLSKGGTHALTNLQPLCKSCHSYKTAKFDKGKGV